MRLAQLIVSAAITAAVAVAAFPTVPTGETTFLSPPSGKSGTPVGLIFIQGAQINHNRYTDFLTALQNSVSFPLHIALPEFLFDLPLPPLSETVFKSAVNTIASLRQAASLQDLDVYIGGHSLGATAAMEQAFEHPEMYKGAFITGASVLRKYNYTFPIPILSINGELDGLHRISRVGEAFYNMFDRKAYQNKNYFDTSLVQNPVVILDDVTHNHFGDGINPTITIKHLDLISTIPVEVAHIRIVEVISAFMNIHQSTPNTESYMTSMELLKKKVIDTDTFLKPMLDAFYQEAAPHLFEACNSDIPAPHCPWYPAWPVQPDRTMGPSKDCICGTPWTSVAATIMGNIDPSKYHIINTDAIHDVTDTKPYHHAHLWSDCSTSNVVYPCVVNHTTVSQQIYDSNDSSDTGFPPATAHEIRVKMKSRQEFAMHSTNPTADFSLDSEESVCKKINQFAYQWGLDRVSEKARKRFEEYGQPMVFEEDKEPNLPIGPLFINAALKMEDDVDSNNNPILKVTSTAFKTPHEGFVTKLYPDSNGYHYCKLLSPARVVEWIHTDGLRKKMGYGAQYKY